MAACVFDAGELVFQVVGVERRSCPGLVSVWVVGVAGDVLVVSVLRLGRAL